MNISRLSFIFLIILSLNACVSPKIIGEYKYDQGLVVHQLSIKQDSTFRYVVYGDINTSETQGKWLTNKSHLYLTSLDSYKPYLINELYVDTIPGKLFTILDDNQLSIPGTFITVNNNVHGKYYADGSGMIQIPESKGDIKSFTINGVVQGQFTHDIKNNKSNYFTIEYSHSLEKYYVENQKYLIQKNKLVLDSSNLVLKLIK